MLYHLLKLMERFAAMDPAIAKALMAVVTEGTDAEVPPKMLRPLRRFLRAIKVAATDGTLDPETLADEITEVERVLRWKPGQGELV